jgi:hypothetical protein
MASTAFSQDAPPVNPSALLKELREIKTRQEGMAKTQRAQLIQKINAASSSPAAAMDLYLQAMRDTKFEGQNNESVQFLGWKKKQADNLKSKGFREALRLHLSYLSLTLQRLNGADIKALLPALVSYAYEVQADGEFIADGAELLDQPLVRGIFAQYFGISSLLAGVKDWEMTPHNIDSIYAKTILPVYRESKDPRAVEYWSQRIQTEADRAANTNRTFEVEDFNQLRKPQLLWSRAEEMGRIGLKNRSASEMLAVIKAYPTHPDAAGWIGRLESLLQEESQPPK